MSNDVSDAFGKLLTSGGIILFGLAFHLTLGFLARVLIAQWIGKVGYGAVTLGYTMLNTVTILVVLGIDTGVSRYLPRFDDREKRRGVLFSAFQIVIPLSIVSGLAIAASAEFLATSVFEDPSLEPVLSVFGLATPLAACVRLTVGCVRGMEHSWPKVLVQDITLPLLRFSFAAFVLLLGFRSVGVAWAYAGAYSVAVAISLYYLVRYTPLTIGAEAVSYRRELVAFSLPLMITAATYMLFHSLDTFLLGALSTTGDVGVYNAVYPLAQLLTTALTAFGFLLMPILSKFHSDSRTDDMLRVFQIVSKWILFGTLPVFLAVAFYPEFVITYTFGVEYVSGSVALTVLAVAFFSHAASGPGGKTLVALGRNRTIMYDNAFVAVVNGVLNVVLIPRYSFLGAAVATLAGFALLNGLYLIQLYRSAGIHPLRREMYLPAATGTVIWGGTFLSVQTLQISSTVTLIVHVALFVLLYPIVILRFGGIESADLDLLARLEDRIGVDLGAIRSVARKIHD